MDIIPTEIVPVPVVSNEINKPEHIIPWIIAASILLFILFFIVLFRGFIQKNPLFFSLIQTNIHFIQIKITAGYHVYEPAQIIGMPSTLSSLLVNVPFAGSRRALLTDYNFPLKEIKKGVLPNQIVVLQGPIDKTFTLKAFFRKEMADFSGPSEIMLGISVDKKGYMFFQQSTQVTRSALIFLTHDNVLVKVISATASPSELVQFAVSMK